MCTYCNTPIFAKALDQESYTRAAAEEEALRQQATGCVVLFLLLGGALIATISLIYSLTFHV